MRQVGNRKPNQNFKKAAEFLKTVIALRGNKPFIKKGVYRFKTFLEAQKFSFDHLTQSLKKSENNK